MLDHQSFWGIATGKQHGWHTKNRLKANICSTFILTKSWPNKLKGTTLLKWNSLGTYCWWKKCGLPVDMVNIPSFTRFSYRWLAGFQPSTVAQRVPVMSTSFRIPIFPPQSICTCIRIPFPSIAAVAIGPSKGTWIRPWRVAGPQKEAGSSSNHHFPGVNSLLNFRGVTIGSQCFNFDPYMQCSWEG